jgi:hypothetical protein
MPLQKILLKPGVNRENTRYTNEGGYYESDNVRFRQGTPEKIGGWVRISAALFLGVCRSLWNWVTLSYQNLIGVGTNLKFYILNGGLYYDITPTQTVHTLTNPFTTVSGSTTVTVTDSSITYTDGGFVTFTPTVTVGGTSIGGEYQITYVGGFSYTITVAVAATSTVVVPAGGTVYAVYQINIGPAFATPLTGWGAGAWGSGAWGIGPLLAETARIWNQFNFGEDLLYGPRGGPLYYWDATIGYTASAVTMTIAEPCVVTSTLVIPNLTAIVLETSGALPTGLLVGTTYYTRYVSPTTFNLSTSTTSSAALSGVIITGIAGQFSCTASSIPLVVGQSVTISGGFNGVVALTGNKVSGFVNTVASSGGEGIVALSGNKASAALGTMVASGGTTIIPAGNFASGFVNTVAGDRTITISGNTGLGFVNTVITGSISGYVSPTTYYIIATNGSTTFTLSTTAGGVGVVTTIGATTGLAYTLSTTINTSGSQSGTHKISQRGVLVSQLNGANSVPLSQIFFLVSDASRFVLCFGTNDIGSTVVNPLLIRWSDQESVTEWSPSITNQAGSIGLSHGSTIVTAIQSKQEIVVFTDAALYSVQYLGPPYVWGSQLLADNTSIAGANSVALAAGIIYWMGVDKFYKYDGRLQTLNCDLLRYVYNDINREQFDQVYAATNEGFNEVWWFYPSEGSSTNDSYVIFNYVENVWYYGTMARTAWLDSGLQDYPVAATYSSNLVQHELGVDDGTAATAVPINAFITSSQFDIGDGHNFAFVWRMLPDLTFNGSTNGATPSLTMQLLPLQNSGSGFNNPKSVGGDSSSAEGVVTATQTYPIDLDTYNGQLNIRVRARQMAMKISSNTLGTQWQLGAPRIDIRQDGRR